MILKKPVTYDAIIVLLQTIKNLLSYNLYFKILETIKKIPLENIGFTAYGEPFFYYTKIIDYLSELSNKNTKKVSFTTNLTLLNEPRIKKLKELSDATQIEYFFVYSIDGITKETYENTRIGSNFEKVINNLKILKNILKIFRYHILEKNQT